MGSFWLEEEAPALPATRLEGDPEVVVVGGGVTGCSCALTLAQAGVRVRLVEAGAIASGASGRNGGFALRGGAMPYDAARRELGAGLARHYWELTERALARLASLAGDAFVGTGSLRLAADEREGDELRAEYEALVEDGFAAEWLDDPPAARRALSRCGRPPDGWVTAAGALGAASGGARRRGRRRAARARARPIAGDAW